MNKNMKHGRETEAVFRVQKGFHNLGVPLGGSITKENSLSGLSWILD